MKAAPPQPNDGRRLKGGYDPQEYYGLPECDGSRPIQLKTVTSDGGIIENLTTTDLIVAVKHDDEGTPAGDYCGGTILEGGEQTAYETYASGEPSRITIRAVEDTGRNRDRVCAQTGMGVSEGGDGCVNPSTFRGYQEQPSEDTPDRNDVVEDAQEAVVETEEPSQTATFEYVRATFEKCGVNTPWITVEATLTYEQLEADEITFTYVVESPSNTFRKDQTTETSVGSNKSVSHTFRIGEWENVDGDSREERAQNRRDLFTNSEIHIEYDNERYEASKQMDC